jgi:enoyl-ACP reductase-like protein
MDRGDHSALDTSLETWRRVHDANLTSIFLSCRHGIPHLRDTDPAGGSVINAASFLAEIGAATAPMAYAAAKAGVVQLSRDLGVHLARSGVRVNAVLFGPIDTPDQRAVFDRNPGALEKRLVHWPMGRFGTLAEAAGTIAFLGSDDSGFVTAAALPLDGGITEAFTVPEYQPAPRAQPELGDLLISRETQGSSPGPARPVTLKAGSTGNASIKPAHAGTANAPSLPETPQFPWSASEWLLPCQLASRGTER